MAENLWLSFAFLTASVYATLSLLDKVVLESEVSTPYITSALNSLSKFLVFIIVGVVTGNTLLMSGLPSGDTLVPIAIGLSISAVNLYSRIIYYRGMEVADVSQFIRGTGAIPRPSGRGYAPSHSDPTASCDCSFRVSNTNI